MQLHVAIHLLSHPIHPIWDVITWNKLQDQDGIRHSLHFNQIDSTHFVGNYKMRLQWDCYCWLGFCYGCDFTKLTFAIATSIIIITLLLFGIQIDQKQVSVKTPTRKTFAFILFFYLRCVCLSESKLLQNWKRGVENLPYRVVFNSNSSFFALTIHIYECMISLKLTLT